MIIGGHCLCCAAGKAQRRDLVRRYAAGATLEQISAEVGLSISTVWETLRAEGVNMRKRGAPRGAQAKTLLRAPVMARLHREGATMKTIAKQYNLTTQRISQILALYREAK